ncbi:MAG: R3H domain-containing nucleic acid-binding protein [Chloroflexota bacterium]
MSDRDLGLLWRDVRLAVLDIETVWDPGGFGGSARDETDRAIEAVRATGQPVRLAPQPRKVRWQQHATIEAAGLTSMSHGQEPDRAVEVRSGSAVAPVRTAISTQVGGEFRVASVAICDCVRGKVGAPWHTLVNPGVPVDPETGKRHKLTDAQLAVSPPFAAIADHLLRRLTPAEGELLVLAGHNVGYDVGVLRGEMRRVGKALPDLWWHGLRAC